MRYRRSWLGHHVCLVNAVGSPLEGVLSVRPSRRGRALLSSPLLPLDTWSVGRAAGAHYAMHVGAHYAMRV